MLEMLLRKRHEMKYITGLQRNEKTKRRKWVMEMENCNNRATMRVAVGYIHWRETNGSWQMKLCLKNGGFVWVLGLFPMSNCFCLCTHVFFFLALQRLLGASKSNCSNCRPSLSLWRRFGHKDMSFSHFLKAYRTLVVFHVS